MYNFVVFCSTKSLELKSFSPFSTLLFNLEFYNFTRNRTRTGILVFISALVSLFSTMATIVDINCFNVLICDGKINSGLNQYSNFGVGYLPSRSYNYYKQTQWIIASLAYLIYIVHSLDNASRRYVRYLVHMLGELCSIHVVRLSNSNQIQNSTVVW